MINYLSLKSHVYNFISEKIRDGSLKPDEKISEQQICDTLNISRTPVREALIQLSAEGLLINEPRKGFRVKPLTLEEARELYTLIGHLETLAVALSIEKLDEEDLSKMENLIEVMKIAIEKDEYDNYYQAQVDFHNVYLYKTENTELINILKKLKMRFLRQGYTEKNNGNFSKIFEDTNKEHVEILRLFRKKDKKKLQSFLRDIHWDIDHAALDVI